LVITFVGPEVTGQVTWIVELEGFAITASIDVPAIVIGDNIKPDNTNNEPKVLDLFILVPSVDYTNKKTYWFKRKLLNPGAKVWRQVGELSISWQSWQVKPILCLKLHKLSEP